MRLYISTMIFNSYDVMGEEELKFELNKKDERNFEFDEESQEYFTKYIWSNDKYKKGINTRTNCLGLYVCESVSEEPITSKEDIELLKVGMVKSIKDYIIKDKEYCIKMFDEKIKKIDTLEIKKI